jgi:sulfite reductase alpha subunit-like flavoprotein
MPQRSFFEGLAAHATNDDEKEKLLEIASAAGTDLYYDYCIKEKRNYVEVMEDFKSARPPLDRLLELLPLIQPRHYSIANSGRVCPGEIDLCVAVATSKTPYGRRKVGLCSGFLARQAPGDVVLLWVRRGAFALDKHVVMAERAVVDAAALPVPPPPLPTPTPTPRSTLILVGPGTGVAPMRAILQERVAAAAPPASMLFFGCRGRHADFLYGDEWHAWSHDVSANTDDDADAVHGDGVSVVTAFSRDQPHKVYVTDKLRRHGARVWALLDPTQARGVVFVSGSAKRMPADVRAALRDVVVAHGARTEAEAAAFLLQMEKEGRYIVEAWS